MSQIAELGRERERKRRTPPDFPWNQVSPLPARSLQLRWSSSLTVCWSANKRQSGRKRENLSAFRPTSLTRTRVLLLPNERTKERTKEVGNLRASESSFVLVGSEMPFRSALLKLEREGLPSARPPAKEVSQYLPY